MASDTARRPRAPLTRERILRAAIELADEAGVEALSMRRLGRRLGVEAMSLYNHVTDRDDILGGMVELVAIDFEVPTGAPDWRTSIRSSARSAHEVLLPAPLGEQPGRVAGGGGAGPTSGGWRRPSAC